MKVQYSVAKHDILISPMVNKSFTLTLVYNPYTLVRCISTIELVRCLVNYQPYLCIRLILNTFQTMELVSCLVSKVRKGTKIANYVPKQVGR